MACQVCSTEKPKGERWPCGLKTIPVMGGNLDARDYELCPKDFADQWNEVYGQQLNTTYDQYLEAKK